MHRVDCCVCELFLPPLSTNALSFLFHKMACLFLLNNEKRHLTALTYNTTAT
eukprot:m.55566 g.55566  ORF g.55566 m.55566 type:complete len:52 (-) comp11132_c0_seq1:51-206(-)